MEKKVRTQRCLLRAVLVTNWISQGQVSNGEEEKQDKAKHMEKKEMKKMKGKGANLKDERKGGGEGSRRKLGFKMCFLFL